jgi:hypothetical protein
MIPVRKGGRANLYRSEDSGTPSSSVINCMMLEGSKSGRKKNNNASSYIY